MTLTIVASIHAKPGHEHLVQEELKKLVEPTRAERGCLRYDLHQDHSAPTHFLFYETWESRELWQAHMSAPHIDAYMQATVGAVDQFLLNEMERVA